MGISPPSSDIVRSSLQDSFLHSGRSHTAAISAHLGLISVSHAFSKALSVVDEGVPRPWSILQVQRSY